MSYYGNKDFYFSVSEGLTPGYSRLNKFGRNPDIGTATDPEDVWDAGGVWVKPTQARIHDIASTSGNDAAAGSGALTIRVYGLTECVIK